MWCPFFSLHGQTLDFITADVSSEGKELGRNSTTSEDVGVSHVGEAVRYGAVWGKDQRATGAIQINVSFMLWGWAGSRPAETVRMLARARVILGYWTGIEVEMCVGYHLWGMAKYRRQLVIKGLCNLLKGNCKHLEMARASNKPMLSLLLRQPPKYGLKIQFSSINFVFHKLHL